MNILDENTKVMLDAGKVAVLNGRYLIMTPETFKSALVPTSAEALRIVFDGEAPEQGAKAEANIGSMNRACKCRFCGKESQFTEYTLTIEGGYDSDHDMEVVSMNVCSRCLERMLAKVCSDLF